MSNITVQIRNYQILENAKLEFEDGLNIIVGPSNNGKSAIIRAIEALIYNKAGNSFIRSGEESAAVAFKNENHVVIWQKSSDAGIYKIDGQTYNKIGRGQLTEVANALQMSEIDVNDDKVRVNFLKQMEYPFLLDKNPSQLFSFLSMSNDGDRLTSIFQKMRSDLKSTNSSIDTLTGKIDGYKETITREESLLNNYKGIDELNNKILSYDSKAQQLQDITNRVEQLDREKQSLLEYKQSIIKHREVKSKLDNAYGNLDNLIVQYNEIGSILDKLNSYIPKLSKLEEKVNSLKTVISTLDEGLNKIDISLIQTKKDLYNEVSSRYTSLSSSKGELEKRKASILSLRSSLDEINNQLSTFKVCPLCGSLLK